MKLQEIEMDKIIIPNTVIRKDLDEEKLQELAESIKSRGLLQPIVVLQKGETYEIIAGLRRFLACSSLGWERIPAIVWEGEEYNASLAQLEENIVREDVTALEEGLYFKHLMKAYGLTTKQIAEDIHKSIDYVEERIRLTEADVMIQKAVQERLINFSVAKVLSRVEDVNIRRGLLEQAIKEDLTVEQVKTLVKEYNKPVQNEVYQEQQVIKDNNTPTVIHHVYVCPICREEHEQIDSIFLQVCPTCYAQLMEELRKG